MVELLKHDFKLLYFQWKKTFIILLFLPVAFYLLGSSPEFGSDSELYIHPVLSILVVLIGISMYTTKELTGVLMNSIPTEKVEIVKSRFIFMIINTLVISIYLLLVAYLLRNNGHEVYIRNGNSILAFLNIGLSSLAILMPIGFVSAKGLEVTIMIIFFITLWFGWFIWRVALMYMVFNTITTIILLVISYFLSKESFKEKEFD